MFDENLSKLIDYIYSQGYLDCLCDNGLIRKRDYIDLTTDNWKKMKGGNVDYGEDYLKSLRRGDGDGQAGKWQPKEDARHQSAG
jgi:hypothetical protein